MHEFGICEAVVAELRGRAAGRRVAGARVRVSGHAMNPAVIAEGVAMLAAGTEAEGVALEVIVDSPHAECRSCGADQTVTDAADLVACRTCGGVDVEVSGGEQGEAVEVESLELVGGPDSTTSSEHDRGDEARETVWTRSNF